MSVSDQRTAVIAIAVLLNRRQAADHLNVSDRTVANWAGKPGGPPMVRISKRCVRYRLEDLDAWLAARSCATSTEPTAAEVAAASTTPVPVAEPAAKTSKPRTRRARS